MVESRPGPIGVGADHAGRALKEQLKARLAARGFSVRDFGTDADTSCDYADFAHAVARALASGEFDRALLVCGTGVGMAMAANRHVGVRAVVCSDVFSARMARQHNDANVLCLGARVVGSGLAEDLLDAFLRASFEGGRHEARVLKIEPT